MQIKDLKVGLSKVFLEGLITQVSDERTIQSTGDKVVDVIIKDETGSARLGIFGDKVSLVKDAVGKRIKIGSAYVRKEYEGMMDITLGKFGTMEII